MDFALFLFVLVIITGIVWAFYWFYHKKKSGIAEDERGRIKHPWWYEYCGSFFIVILAVFVIRSFIIEPFRIPSSSMVPTLLPGDFILTNKFAYGIRLPILNMKVIDIGEPQAGDIVVFQYPEDTTMNYIKRLIGRPGDIVSYQNKVLMVNGKQLSKEYLDEYLNAEQFSYSTRYTETLGNVSYRILNDKSADDFMTPHLFPHRESCEYNATGFTCKVPEGHYFMMGDNRDNSADSRVWGFVPKDLLVGKAVFIWFHLNDLSRIGFIN